MKNVHVSKKGKTTDKMPCLKNISNRNIKYIYIYIYIVCMCMYVYVYIYTYTYNSICLLLYI